MYKKYLQVLALVWLVVTCSIGVTSSTVEQVFPANVDYCCHCPNIKLKCTFSEKPVTAFWSVLRNDTDTVVVISSTPGHTVDKSEIQNGTLYLMVNNTVYSEGNLYSCTAVFPNGETENARSFPIPMAENLSAPIHNLQLNIEPLQKTLNVQWDHDYYLCRNFTVYLNETAIPECTSIITLNCTIRYLDAAIGYKVTVVATESDTKPVIASRTVTALDITSIGSRVGVCIWQLLLVVILWNFAIMFW